MSPLIRFIPLIVLLAATAAAQDINEKALRYYEALQRRPAAGPVFDRFVDAWLDSGTLEQLEAWLEAGAAARPAVQSRILLALFHMRQGAHAKAIQQYRAALALEPGNAELWHQRALAESRLLDFDEAIASLEKGLEQKPPEELSLVMRQLLGRLLVRSGRTPEALAIWQQLMAGRPDDAALREDVLDLQLAEGLFDAAVENATALMNQAPDAYRKAMRRIQLADVLDRAGRTDAALVEWEQCLADSGSGSWVEKEVLARFERTFRRDDNLTGLRAQLDALLQRQPQRQGLQRARVRLLSELGEKSAAVDAWLALLALSPGDRPLRDEFIALLIGAGRLDEAVAQTSELVKQAPQDHELLLRLADLKLQAGDKPGCLAAVAQYDQLTGGDEAARLRAAALFDRAGMTAETIDRLKSAAAAFPASDSISSALAPALYKARRRDEAIAEWKRRAAGATGPGLLEIGRSLSAHGEDETAWELLSAKAADGDGMLLMQLCELSEKLGREEDALPAARRLVTMAQGTAGLDAALEQSSKLIKRAGQSDAVIATIDDRAGVADLCLLAELLEQRGDSAAANAALERVAAAEPGTADSQRVRLSKLRQDWPRALEAGARLFHAPGGRKAATARMLADFAERSRDPEAALSWIREWRKLSPGTAPAVLEEARLLRTLGRDGESLRVLRLAAGQMADNPEIRSALAQACRDAGQFPEALSLFAGLYEQAPDAAQKLRVIHLWAETAAEANRIPELLDQFDERRRQNRTATGPLLALAEIHAINGDREKQQRMLSDAARIRPDDADLALQLSSIQEADGLIPVAMDTLKSAMPYDKTGRVRQRLARLHLSAGDESEGLRLIDGDGSGAPPDAAAVESMALSLMSSDPARAVSLLRSLPATGPDAFRLRYLLGVVLAASGDQMQAIQEWARLLELKEENPLPSAPASSPVLSAAVEAQLQQLSSSVPEDLLTLLRIHEIRSGSRQVYRPNPGNRSTAGANGSVQLPGNFQELRALTLMQLALTDDWTAPAGEEAARILKSAGFENIRELLLPLPEFSILGPAYSGSSLTEELKKLGAREGDRQAGGLYLLLSLLSGKGTIEREQARAAWDQWSRTHSDFAAAAVIAALTDSGEAGDWEKEAIGLLARPGRPPLLLLAGAVRYLERGGMSRFEPGIPNGVPAEKSNGAHREVLEILTKWLESDWISAPSLNRHRRDLAGGLVEMAAESGDTPLLARIVNAEWGREERSVTPSATAVMPFYGGGSFRTEKEFLTPIAWPPESIPGVSPVFAGHGALNHLSAEDAATLAGQVKPETLRAFLSDRGAGAGHPLPALCKLASSPGADTAAMLLSATSMAEAEQFDEAAAFAARALEHPLPPETRRLLNASIIAWAEESMAAAGSPLHSAAREAALRLRREAQSPEQKAQLAAAMESLGLSTEAAALTSGGLPGAYTRVYAGRSIMDGDQALLRAVKQELENFSAGGEVPLTVKALRRHGRAMLSSTGWMDEPADPYRPQGFSGSNEEDTSWPALFKLMTEKQAENKVLAALDPGPSADARHLAVFGAVQEFMGSKSRAVELYHSALAAGITAPGALVRLTKLLWQDDRSAAGRLFITCPPDAQEKLAQVILPLGEREMLENVIAAARMAIDALEKRDRALIMHFEWLTKLLVLLEEDLPIDADLRAPKLNTPGSGEPLLRPSRPAALPDSMEKARSLLKVRLEVHGQLCRGLLNVPGAASLAFVRLRALSQPGADLTREAIAACAAMSRTRTVHATAAMRQMQLIMSMSTGMETGGGLMSLAADPPPPDAILNEILDSAIRLNSPDLLRRELIPALQSAGSNTFAEQVELLAALYFGPVEQVEETARRLVAADGTTAWPRVIRGLNHRHVNASLSTLVATELIRARAQPGQLLLLAESAADYCDWLCREGRSGDARQLLDRITEILTGLPAQRAAAIFSALNGSLNSQFGFLQGNSTGAAQPSAAVYVAFLKRLIESNAAAFIALDAIHSSLLPSLPPEIRPAILSALDIERAPFTKAGFFADPARSAAWFSGSPLLADPDGFRSYGSSSGVFATIADLLNSMGTEERKPVLDFLRAQPAAFGRDLLIASASDRWGGSAVNAAAPYIEKLKSLPEDLQAEAVDLLASLATGRDRQKFSPEGVTLMNWVEQKQSVMLDAAMTARIDWYLNPRSSLSRGGSMSRNPAETALPLLRAAVRGLSPKAYDIVRRTSILAGNRAPQAIGTLLAGGMAAESGSTQLPPDASAFRLGLLTSALCSADRQTPALIEPLRLALPRTTRWITGKLTGSAEERLASLVTALSPHVKEGGASVLLEAFPLPVTADDTPESRAALRRAAIAWAEGAGKSAARQDIVREITAAARLEEAMETTDGATGTTDEAALPPEQAHYLSNLRSESLPLSARLTIAGLLADFAGPWLEPPLIAQAAAVLESAMASRRPLEDWQRNAIAAQLADAPPGTAVDSAAKHLVQRLILPSRLDNPADRAEAKTILRLALKAGNASAADRALNRLQGGSGDPDVLAMLLRSGEAARIQSALEQLNTASWTPALCTGREHYDAALGRALAAALPQLNTPGERFRLELAVHCLPPAAGMPPRLERMAEIAGRIKDYMDQANEEEQNLLLDFFTVEPAAALSLREFFIEPGDTLLPPAGLYAGHDDPASSEARTSRLILLSVFAAGSDGDTGFLERALTAAVSSIDAESFSRGPGMTGLDYLTYASRGIAHGWDQWDRTKQEAVKDFLLKRQANQNLLPPGADGTELSTLPAPLLEALNADTP